MIMDSGGAIGVIDVSGTPGGQFDAECARAALTKIQERMKCCAVRLPNPAMERS